MFSIQTKLFGRRIFDHRIYVFVGAICLLFLFDLIAIYFSLYFLYDWIDIPVHVAGGFILGLLLYYTVYANRVTSRWFNIPRTKQHIFSTMVFWALVVAISWEIVEFVLGRTVLSAKFAPDTFIDIVATVSGVLGAYAIIKKMRIK